MKSLLFASLTTLSLFKLSNAACSGAYAQCGGANFQGESCCVSGFQCVKQNDWYSSCQPGAASNDAVSSVPSSNAVGDEWNNGWNNNQWDNNANNQWNNNQWDNNANNQWNNNQWDNNANNQWNNNQWDNNANNQWNNNQWDNNANNQNNQIDNNANNQWNTNNQDNQWNANNQDNQWNANTGNTPAANTGNSSFSQGSGLKFYSQCNNPMNWAVTYDDGPTEFADDILDLLKEKNIKATFFLVGNLYMSSSSPDWSRIVKRMYSEGHTIGNHTYNHKDLTELSADQITSEMKQLEDAVFQVIGKRPAFMRPPYGSGNGNQNVMSALQAAGYTAAITWNVDPMDYSNGGDISYAKQVINQAKGQPIITLNHLKYGGATKDGIIALAKAEIETMIANGYTPVTMEECLGISAYQ